MASLPVPHARDYSVTLYHTTVATRVASILRSGVLPECSRCVRREVWLHTKGRLRWGLAHVAERHGSDRVVSLRVTVPRAWLTRRRPGVWTTSRRIGPERIQAVCVVGLLRASAA
jgi:hypothetical protein